MPNPIFKETFHFSAPDGSITLEPSPYIRGEALVTPRGHRALRLVRSMSPSRSGPEQFHITPARARKLYDLFFHGFDVLPDGANDYIYVRGKAEPMRLHAALNFCRAMEVA